MPNLPDEFNDGPPGLSAAALNQLRTFLFSTLPKKATRAGQLLISTGADGPDDNTAVLDPPAVGQAVPKVTAAGQFEQLPYPFGQDDLDFGASGFREWIKKASPADIELALLGNVKPEARMGGPGFPGGLGANKIVDLNIDFTAATDDTWVDTGYNVPGNLTSKSVFWLISNTEFQVGGYPGESTQRRLSPLHSPWIFNDPDFNHCTIGSTTTALIDRITLFEIGSNTVYLSTTAAGDLCVHSTFEGIDLMPLVIYQFDAAGGAVDPDPGATNNEILEGTQTAPRRISPYQAKLAAETHGQDTTARASAEEAKGEASLARQLVANTLSAIGGKLNISDIGNHVRGFARSDSNDQVQTDNVADAAITVNKNSWESQPQVGDIVSVGTGGRFRRNNTEIGPAAPHSVPSGGTDGQVLTKLSGDDYDADWENPTGGGGSGLTPEQAAKLAGIATGANRVVPYKIGNVYRAMASGQIPDKPADSTGNATAAGITTAPPGWQLTRPEATEALPWIFDCHTYGYDINGVFGWQFGTPNRTDRFVTATGGGGGLDQAAVDARVRALTADFAEQDSSDAIPDSKVPSSIARVSFVEGEVDAEEAARIAADNSEAAARASADGAETLARITNDNALTDRIDGLVAAPSEGATLLDLVAKTYPRDVQFTLGTRIPGGSDPGYNKGTHSLNAAGSFSETGIPPDIVTLYRVTESETIGGVQLQNRLVVGVDEEGGSRRYEGERIRWAGQILTLTYFQRSLNNFNEYRTNEVLTTLATAGQSVNFNIEDVQAEARAVLPFPAWIWHHSVATTTEHISNADFTDATASTTLAPTQHAVADYALGSDALRTSVRALGSASDSEVASERGTRLALDAISEQASGTRFDVLVNHVQIFSQSASGAVTRTQASSTFPTGFTKLSDYDLIHLDVDLSNTANTRFGSGHVSFRPENVASSPRPFLLLVPHVRPNNSADSEFDRFVVDVDNDGTINVRNETADNSDRLHATMEGVKFNVTTGGGGVGGLTGPETYSRDLLFLKSATATPENTNLPTGITASATGYGGITPWVTVPPTAEVGFNILVTQITRTFSGGNWIVGLPSGIGYFYRGTIQHNPIRYIDEGGFVSFTQDIQHHYQQIWDEASGTYSQPIPIEGRASVNLRLLALQNLPVSGTATAGPTINTPRTLFSDYPKLGFKISLVVGNIIIRQKYFEIPTADINPVSQADQNQTRAQRMLAVAVNSPFAAGPNWIDVALIDGNTTVQRSPNGYERRYLMNFVRDNADPAGSTVRAFSYIVVAEHDAGTFGSGVRMEVYGVQ